MQHLDVRPDLDQLPWSDLRGGSYREAIIERVGLLRDGTESGRAVLAIVARCADGSVVVAETTLRLADVAVRALASSPVYVADRAVDEGA